MQNESGIVIIGARRYCCIEVASLGCKFKEHMLDITDVAAADTPQDGSRRFICGAKVGKWADIGRAVKRSQVRPCATCADQMNWLADQP